MATYKKRGYKPTTKAEKVKEVKAEELESTTAEVFNTLDEQASKTEEWVAKNQKYIFIAIGAVALFILAYLAYNNFVQGPKEAEASNEMFQANAYFDQALKNEAQRDSLFTLALDGGEGKYGYLKIIENYSGTDAANLATYSAGMAYLNLRNYEKAVEYLQDFKSNDVILGAKAKGAIGDAFAQLVNQQQQALEYYEKAFAHSTNGATTPIYLLKAGITAMELGQNDKALLYFNRIKDEYDTFAKSPEGQALDIYIGKAEASK